MPVEAIEIMILFIKVRDKGYFVIEATFFPYYCSIPYHLSNCSYSMVLSTVKTKGIHYD